MAIPDESDFSCLHPNARVKFDGGNQAVVCNSCDKIVTHLRGDVTRVAELEAVIQKAQKHLDIVFGNPAGYPFVPRQTNVHVSTMRRILSAAPSVVLGEHDRGVRATELEEAARIAEVQAEHGRYSPARVEKCQDIAKLLRERAAAIRNGEHA